MGSLHGEGYTAAGAPARVLRQRLWSCRLGTCLKSGVCARAGMAGGGRSCADKEAETMIAAAEKAAAEKAGRSTSEPAISVLHNVRAASLAFRPLFQNHCSP